MHSTIAKVFLIALLVAIGAVFAIVVVKKQYSPAKQPSVQPPVGQSSQGGVREPGVSAKSTGAKYKTVSSKPTGWFQTGQYTDIMLSGIDFNNTGGPLLFNHPGGVASDGKRLLLADRNNNRVLIWNKLPTGNTPPDLVLGQKDFTANNPGTGLDELNWPVAVATANEKVIVADTYNDRLLVWNSFPNKSGQSADVELKGDRNIPKRTIGWPWAVWTNGEKVVVTSTAGSRVLIWNSFPTQNNQPADLVLTANNNFGTPRSIGSDGKHLMIGDHNAKPNEGRAGNFFWKTFPTKDDQPYDFFVGEIGRMGEQRPPNGQPQHGDVLWGGMTADGKLFGITNMLYIWDAFPNSDSDGPDIKIGGVPGQQGYDFGGKQSGDGTGAIVANGKLYISLSNGNKIVGFNSLPTKQDEKPDFAIGAPDINTNTLETYNIMSNAVPATDGKSLFVSSDFDNKLYVWKNLPDESGAKPDLIYNIGGWDNELHNGVFAQVNQREVYIWKKPPLEGEKPDLVFKDSIGAVKLNEIKGVAIDDKYFYLSDAQANKIYAWEGLPDQDKAPKYTIATNEPIRLSSDGKYLVVTATTDNQNGHVRIYKVDSLTSDAKPVAVLDKSPNSKIRTNLPQLALASKGALFVADTGNNRVMIWKNIDDAIAGKEADVILGAQQPGAPPEIGKNKLFWPAGLAFDGSFLWVGEFKFSERLLRFSVR